jgi:hypothetical protein
VPQTGGTVTEDAGTHHLPLGVRDLGVAGKEQPQRDPLLVDLAEEAA